jgi:hypothetical protein
MPIEFETPKPLTQAQVLLKTVGEEMIRPQSRYYDEHGLHRVHACGNESHGR